MLGVESPSAPECLSVLLCDDALHTVLGVFPAQIMNSGALTHPAVNLESILI